MGPQFNGTRVVDNGVSGIIGHVGQPGTGKSYEMARTILGCARVAMFDPKNQYGDGPRQNRLPGFVTVRQPGELKNVLRRAGRGRFRILYQPPRMLSFDESAGRGKKGTRDIDAHFRAFLLLLMAAGDAVVAVDELWLLCEPVWMPQPLEEISRASRHYGVTFLYTAQRPQIVASDLRDNTNQWKTFRLQGLAVEALRGRVPDEVLEQVPTLPDRTHIKSDDTFAWQRIVG